MTIRSLFQPSLKSVNLDGSINTERKSIPIMPTVFVIPRSLCSFTRSKLPAASNKGIQAAKLQASRNQRYTNPHIRVEPDGKGASSASIWSWDSSFLTDDNKKLSDLICIPETLARVPGKDGVRLVRCAQGLEGEIWQEGTLTASRWWRDLPSQQDWRLFLRAGKLRDHDTSQAVPDPVSVPWRDDLPVVDNTPEHLSLTFSPVRIMIAATAILAFFASVQLSQQFLFNNRIETIKEKLEVVSRENRDAYRTRAEALAALNIVNNKSNLDDPLELLRVIVTLTETIPTSTAELANITIAEQRMEARFRVQETPDITQIVSELEQSPIFTDVFIESPNRNSFSINASVTASLIDSNISSDGSGNTAGNIAGTTNNAPSPEQ